ncbi:EamA family transporter [Candidatus Woesearchaeota archaeon]|nr:EamA family transporter [Candidatus Woesearchaeota archaeon]
MNNLTAIAMVFTATIFGSFGSLYLKKGSKVKIGLKFEHLKSWLNKNLIKGALLYAVSTIFYLYALSITDLSIVYPITSLSYVWTALLSKLFLKETINLKRWTGIILVVLGVAFITLK